MNKIIVIGLCMLIILVGCDKETPSIITQDKIDCQEICDNETLNLRYVSRTKETLYCHCEMIKVINTNKDK